MDKTLYKLPLLSLSFLCGTVQDIHDYPLVPTPVFSCLLRMKFPVASKKEYAHIFMLRNMGKYILHIFLFWEITESQDLFKFKSILQC